MVAPDKDYMLIVIQNPSEWNTFNIVAVNWLILMHVDRTVSVWIFVHFLLCRYCRNTVQLHKQSWQNH
jgi:hypothetical protein